MWRGPFPCSDGREGRPPEPSFVRCLGSYGWILNRSGEGLGASAVGRSAADGISSPRSHGSRPFLGRFPRMPPTTDVKQQENQREMSKGGKKERPGRGLWMEKLLSGRQRKGRRDEVRKTGNQGRPGTRR